MHTICVMVYFGVGGLQHSFGLLMLVPCRSNIDTNPDYKKKTWKEGRFSEKNFNIQVIGRLHDIQWEYYEVSNLFWNILILRMLNKVRGNDFESVQSVICGACTCLDLYLQQMIIKVSDVCTGAQSALCICNPHQLAETWQYLVNDPTPLGHVTHFPTSFKGIKAIFRQLPMPTSGIIFMPMYAQSVRDKIRKQHGAGVYSFAPTLNCLPFLRKEVVFVQQILISFSSVGVSVFVHDQQQV